MRGASPWAWWNACLTPIPKMALRPLSHFATPSAPGLGILTEGSRATTRDEPPTRYFWDRLFVAACLWLLGCGVAPAALASEEELGLTRLAIEIVGGPLVLTHHLTQDPPTIRIDVQAPHVTTSLEPDVTLDQGMVRRLGAVFSASPTGRRTLTQLTVTLREPASYRVVTQPHQVLIDIDTRIALLSEFRTGAGFTVRSFDAKAALLHRLKAMEQVLQQVAPPFVAIPPTPRPVVVMHPSPRRTPQAPAPLVARERPEDAPAQWWPWLIIAGMIAAVAGFVWRRRAAWAPARTSGLTAGGAIASGTVVERCFLNLLQRQGHRIVRSQPIAEVGRVWVLQRDGVPYGMTCLGQRGVIERDAIERVASAFRAEGLPTGRIVGLGPFSEPARMLARSQGLLLMTLDDVLDVAAVELGHAAATPDVELLSHQLAASQQHLRRLQEELAHAATMAAQTAQQAHTQAERSWEETTQVIQELKRRNEQLESQLAQVHGEHEQLKRHWENSEWFLGEERAKRTALERRLEELSHPLSPDAAQEASAHPEGDSWNGVDRRRWPRRALRPETGGIGAPVEVVVSAIPTDREEVAGFASNISEGGVCVEWPGDRQIPDTVPLRLFLPACRRPIEATGRCVWRRHAPDRQRQCVGVAFDALSPDDRREIAALVGEPGRGQTPEGVRSRNPSSPS